MGLRRRRKAEAELLELVRGELAAMRTELQTALTETAAALSTRVRTEIEQRTGEPRALAAGIQQVRETISVRDTEVVQVLRRVTDACDSLVECVQLDRLERTALADAVGRLTSAVAAAGSPPLLPSPADRATVIGGTVDPPPDEPGPSPAFARVDPTLEGPTVDIDLAAADEPVPVAVPTEPPTTLPARPDGVEVRCRFGDRWVSGFEVCEVVERDHRTRYRLRRRSDGSVIPTLFEEKDLRFFTTTFVEPS